MNKEWAIIRPLLAAVFFVFIAFFDFLLLLLLFFRGLALSFSLQLLTSHSFVFFFKVSYPLNDGIMGRCNFLNSIWGSPQGLRLASINLFSLIFFNSSSHHLCLRLFRHQSPSRADPMASPGLRSGSYVHPSSTYLLRASSDVPFLPPSLPLSLLLFFGVTPERCWRLKSVAPIAR